MDRALKFVTLRKDVVIESWLNGIRKEFPGIYDLEHLGGQGYHVLDMIMAVDMPVHEHPVLRSLPEWSRILFEKQAPVVHILHSTQILREAVLDVLSAAPLGKEPLMRAVRVLSERFDTFERETSRYYWINAHSQLEEQERKLRELHDDKLTLIGKMAASMAHEIRNPLTSIKGFIKLIRTRLPAESLALVEKYIHIIETEFDLIHMQITGFLSFSRKPVEEKFVTISAGELIESVLILANPLLNSESIKLTIDLPEELTLRVQKTPIQQIISNLLSNSIDALRGINGDKRIRIGSEEDGQRIHLTVANNGPKIPDELQGKLFQPFVTGKEHGIGLGLAICKQIMENHNGTISFRSNDKETVFILSFNKEG